jgi:hypothetical protein
MNRDPVMKRLTLVSTRVITSAPSNLTAGVNHLWLNQLLMMIRLLLWQRPQHGNTFAMWKG